MADCPSGDICVPVPGASFGASLCVGQAGDVACPGPDYTRKALYFTGANDTRGCSDCTCKASGSCAAGQVTQYSTTDGTCGGSGNIFGAPFTCYPLGSSTDVKYTATPTLGSCTPSAPTATGTATGTGAYTVCCTP
jgi:hypothetical protein